MSDFVHRTSKQFVMSGNDPDYPLAQWIKLALRIDPVDPWSSPDLSAVVGQPTKYWTITGDVISLMSASEQAAVDSAATDTQRDQTVLPFDNLEDILRAFSLVVLDEINVLRASHSLSPRTISQMKNAARNKLGT